MDYWHKKILVERISQGSDFRTLCSKSLYITSAVSIFYWTKIEILTGFGQIGSTEKKMGSIMSQFWGQFVFMGEKSVVSTGSKLE